MINIPLRTRRRSEPLPVPLDGEVFILSRPGVRFTADLPAPVARRIGADGVVVFTSLRLVFIAPSAVALAAREERGGGSAEARFVSFDVPLASIVDEAFVQPVFGANSLTGTVVAVPGGGLPPGLSATFGFEFRDGGVGTFLPVLIRVLSEARRLAAAPPAPRHQAASARSQIFEDIRLGRFGGAAYVDPSDPTTLFLSQPPRE